MNLAGFEVNFLVHLQNFASKAPAKRSQHANATYRNIVGRNMLRAFGQQCCDMLRWHVAIVWPGLKIFFAGKLVRSLANSFQMFGRHG